MTMTEAEAFAASEAIARGDNCPSCHQAWHRDPKTFALTLTHAPGCSYIAHLDSLLGD